MKNEWELVGCRCEGSQCHDPAIEVPKWLVKRIRKSKTKLLCRRCAGEEAIRVREPGRKMCLSCAKVLATSQFRVLKVGHDNRSYDCKTCAKMSFGPRLKHLGEEHVGLEYIDAACGTCGKKRRARKDHVELMTQTLPYVCSLCIGLGQREHHSRGNRQCTFCGLVLPLDEFNKNGNKKSNWCKACIRADGKRKYSLLQDELAIKGRKYRYQGPRYSVREERDKAIREQLMKTPQNADLCVAQMLGYTTRTGVSRIRLELEAEGKIPRYEMFLGKGGRLYPRNRRGAQRTVRAAVIYFIKATSKNEQYLKIGFTSEIRTRMSAMRVNCPFPVEIVATKYGTREEESELHKRFAHLREYREWYTFSKELEEYISEVKSLGQTIQEVHRGKWGLTKEKYDYIASSAPPG